MPFSLRQRFLGALLAGFILVSLCMIGVAGPLLSVNYKDADLRDVLNALAAQAGVSLTMDETVSGLVSFHFEGTFEECLARLAALYGLQVTVDGRFYSVTKQSIRVQKEGDDLVSVVFQAAKLPAALAELTRVTGRNFTFVGTPPNDRINLVLNKISLADLAAILAETARCQVEERNGAYLFRPGQGQGRFSLRYEDGRLGLDASGVPLATLVRELSAKTGRAVLCDQAAAGMQVTAYFPPLPLEEALGAIAAANGLRLVREGEAYRFLRGEATGVIRVHDGRLTLDVKNAEIGEVLAEIARQARLTIMPARDVSLRVTGTVIEAELEEGLAAFLEANGLVLERQGNTLYVKRASVGQSIIISVNQDGTLDLSVANANLALTLTELAKKKGYGIVVHPNVTWNVASVQIKRASFEEALERLLAGTTYTYRRDGDTYIVGEGINFRQGDTEFLQSELLLLRYVQAESVWNSLPTAFPRQNILLLKENNAFLVTGTPKLIKALKDFLARLDVPPEVRTELIPLRHIKAEEALKLFPPSLPKNEIVVVKDQNALAVTGSEGYRAQVRAYLEKIDLSAPMILFDVLVLQLSESQARGGGLQSLKIEADGQKIEWELGNLVGSIISPGTPAAMKLSATIKAAISDGRAKVRANPKIATLSGTPAQFDVVTKYNYTWPMPVTTPGAGGTTTTTTEYKQFTVDSGIQLVMTPWVSADKEITLELKPRISQYTTSPTEGVGPDVTALPGVMERSTQSTVRIMDGYTVVISGFIQESEEITQSKVPILSAIPILGRLFQSTKKTKRQDEFVIIITPRLIEDPTQIGALVAEVSGPGSAPAPIVIEMDKGEEKERTGPTQ
ncbi:MAG: secretin and TonB N-terminal domain-containing protein [Bacillota bacterium]